MLKWLKEKLRQAKSPKMTPVVEKNYRQYRTIEPKEYEWKQNVFKLKGNQLFVKQTGESKGSPFSTPRINNWTPRNHSP